nr:MAG TPA: hypothetical protein [Caudoviricetes sp.]
MTTCFRLCYPISAGAIRHVTQCLRTARGLKQK